MPGGVNVLDFEGRDFGFVRSPSLESDAAGSESGESESASDHDHPGEWGASSGIEGGRAMPDSDEGVLEALLGFPVIVEHADEH